MSHRIPLPGPIAIAELLEALLGQEVRVARAEAKAIVPSFVAAYLTPEDELAACCVADVEIVTVVGAAMAAVPPGAAKELLAAGPPPENVVENFREVVNVLASLLCSDDTVHVRLATLHGPSLPEEITDRIDGATQRVDFALEVPGYGSGHLSFLVA